MRKRRKPKEPVYLEDAMLELGEQLWVVWHTILDIYEDAMLPILNALVHYIGARQLLHRCPRDALYDTLLWVRRNPSHPKHKAL